MAHIIGIRIKGFQSHEDTYIKLGDGLNVITGPSDSGKTAIIRLVKWIAFNEPTGEAYVNQNVGEAEATLELDTGVTITKRRRKGKTSYQLSTIAEPFEKAEVPLEVMQALGITKQTFGDFETALNFAYQLEAPFLISETASAGAKILGKLAGTEAVDVAIKNVAKDTYAARQERSQAEKDIEKIDAQLAEYMHLDELKEQLEACELMAKEIEANVEKYETMKRLRIKHLQLIGDLGIHKERLDRLAIVTDLQDDLQNIEKAQVRYDKLLHLYSVYNNTAYALQQAHLRLERTKAVEGLDELLQDVERANSRKDSLQQLYTQYTRYTQNRENAIQALQPLHGVEEAATLLEGLHKANDRKEHLQHLQNVHENHTLVLTACNNRLTTVGNVQAATDLLVEIEKDYEKIMQLRRLRALYRLCAQDVAQTTQYVEEATETLSKAKNALADAWDGLTVCPLCEQPIEGGHNHT